MATATATDALTIVAATSFEAAAARRGALGVRVVQGGIRLAGSDQGYETVISFGFAGGLREDVPTGTILVPDLVATNQGVTIACDTSVTAALRDAAAHLGHAVSQERLLTSDALVTGLDRSAWAQRGFVAADMETGFLRARRIAALRIVLDTPQHELSEAWLRPASVIAQPRLWSQGLWLWREGSRCARSLSAVLACALPRLLAAEDVARASDLQGRGL